MEHLSDIVGKGMCRDLVSRIEGKNGSQRPFSRVEVQEWKLPPVIRAGRAYFQGKKSVFWIQMVVCGSGACKHPESCLNPGAGLQLSSMPGVEVFQALSEPIFLGKNLVFGSI